MPYRQDTGEIGVSFDLALNLTGQSFGGVTEFVEEGDTLTGR